MVVEISVGSVAQRVMELAADKNKAYRFTATYFDKTLGYEIDTINDVTSKKPYYWAFYYQSPGKDPVKTNEGVTNFVIPEDGGTVILRYEK